MIRNFTTRVTALLVSTAVSVNQALAFAWPPDTGGGGGGQGPVAAPELDGPGGIAAIAVIVSVAIVLFNRSRNR